QIPVVTIGDINDLKVNSGVPEIHYSFFQKNKEIMNVRITVPALENKQFEGIISNIAPYISPKTRNFVVKCRITDIESLLRPGMFAYLDFVLEKRNNIYSLPYKVLSGGDSFWYVDNEGKARQLLYSKSFGNEEFFQISSDISTYRFIIEGQNFLNDGQRVRILENL
ncbi:MAG: efflux RND transporter periplasmic adaptor subunit, partial [Spirochaetales bacterium]|nr:efflux RND transporter periplasmic adaptor subunit [Spirochaetales bacterium]